ncbi:ATP-binding protein [Streptomyces yaizuensis]|uniref:ATP-binding protein n=1 Tax=Streptomyces yaizuensis TaxID=2989713 RepID=A0ABQ5P4B3_9ACTN|nr:ATP-binding protein [Streptomyces sp. YSPA8]GLF97086.1 ATP-binding protein [Streptomyces sp. YSPA8]
MISQSSKHCTVELQALPSRIGQVRRIISAQLRHWRLDPLIDPAALGVTELLTNVHRHAGPDKMCVVDMELFPGRLTVSVHDHDPRIPALSQPPGGDPLATSGRGLSLIAAVSETWGVEPVGDSGKTVWFTLAAPPQTPDTAQPQTPETAPPRTRDTEPPRTPDTGPPADAHHHPALTG